MKNCISNQNSLGLTLADPVAMAVAVDPEIVTNLGHYFVDIEVTSELTRGQTVVDKFGVWKRNPNVNVI